MCIIQFLDKDGGQSLNEYLPKFTKPRNMEPRKGHFLSDIYQKRNWNKNIRKEFKTTDISFERFIISFKRYNKSLNRYKIE